MSRVFQGVTGFFILVSAALTYWVHPLFVILTAFIGFANLQAGITGFCPGNVILTKLFGNKK